MKVRYGAAEKMEPEEHSGRLNRVPGWETAMGEMLELRYFQDFKHKRYAAQF